MVRASFTSKLLKRETGFQRKQKVLFWSFTSKLLKRETGFQRKQKVLFWSLENGLFSEVLLITISIVCKYQECLSSEFLLYFCCITISIIIFVLRMAFPQNCSCITISIILSIKNALSPVVAVFLSVSFVSIKNGLSSELLLYYYHCINISIICKYQEWPFLRGFAVLLSVSFVSIKNGLSSGFLLYYYQYHL